MQAWLTLLAAVVGAAIALAGQHIARRGDERRHAGELLLEECAQVAALAEDYSDRVWEESVLKITGRVEAWDLRSDRLAASRLRILCDDAGLIATLDELDTAGRRLGVYWRAGEVDPEELQVLRDSYKRVRAAFVEASGAVVREQINR
jgi:hypothetical protein